MTTRRRRTRRPPKRGRRAPTPPPAPLPQKGGTPEIQEARKRAHQDAFLAQFVLVANIDAASRMSGIHRSTHYEWLEQDPAYAARFEQTIPAAVDVLEVEARRRALVGIDKPVFYKGKRVATVKDYSDVLLMFLLNGRRPEVFRPRVEHTGKNGGPIQHTHVIAPVALHELDDAELAVAERLAARIEAAKQQAIPAQSTHA